MIEFKNVFNSTSVIPENLVEDFGDKEIVIICCDGSLKNDPNGNLSGSFAFVKQEKNKLECKGYRYIGNEKDKLNSFYMELSAIDHLISTLWVNSNFMDKADEIQIYSDSKTVIDGINKHLDNWEKNEWKGPTGLTIKHYGIWMNIYSNLEKLKEYDYNITFNYIAGHEGRYINEECDRVAKHVIDNCGF